MTEQEQPQGEELEKERYEILEQLESWLETPVIILGFIWLILLVIELLYGLNPFLETLGFIIWGIFIIDFAVRFVLAPRKIGFLKGNWLTVLSLALPALRVFRAFRAFRTFRSLRALSRLRMTSVVRVVGSLNRGMRALQASMSRRGFGYVLVLSLVITFVGAAGMYAFEAGLDSYGDALWWTAMLMTTLGSDFWPQTAEGRMLAFLLALYGFAIFGYVTATLASFFIGREAASSQSDVVGVETIETLRTEIRALRAELRELRER